MKTLRVTSTTDGYHLGVEFNSEDYPIILSTNFSFYYNKTTVTSDGLRFISSNYVIDTEET